MNHDDLLDEIRRLSPDDDGWAGTPDGQRVKARALNLAEVQDGRKVAPAAPSPWVRRPAVQLGALAATVAMVVGGVQLANSQRGTGGGNAQPAAQRQAPASAADQLNKIADKVATLPNDVGSGDTAQVRTQGWFTDTTDAGGTVEVKPFRQSSTSTVSADGKRTLVLTTTQADGTSKTTRRTFGDGLTWGFDGLSHDPAKLARQLGAQHRQQGTAKRFEAVSAAFQEMPLKPRTRADVLRYLAGTPEMKAVGKVTDRAGRVGDGFTVDSAFSGINSRYLIVIDPDTGIMLGYQTTLIGDASALHVQSPYVTDYTLLSSAHFVD